MLSGDQQAQHFNCSAARRSEGKPGIKVSIKVCTGCNMYTKRKRIMVDSVCCVGD